MQLEFWTDDDDRTTRIVNPLAKKVLAEPALLAFQHVRQGFQRTLVHAADNPTTAAIVKQRVNRFL
jgi:hypothetical protein